MSRSFLSVTELSSRIKEGLEALFPYPVAVKGEVSNLKFYSSGHCYFTLKDDKSVISCVIWASQIEKLTFLGQQMPKEGEEVLATGRVTYFGGRGNIQLNVLSVKPYGIGDALQALEELKKKLASEGLFDESRKRALPPFPKAIGVIAGDKSAGLKDILHNLALRWPLAEVFVFPSLVQGKEAPKDLIRALSLAKKETLDILIIGRGGGASEDLWAFNDESLVREIAKFPCPVISAVGHEIDTTLVDFVADRRVSTPTGAAIAATPDSQEVLQTLDSQSERISKALRSKLVMLRQMVEILQSKPVFQNPKTTLEKRLENLQTLRVSILGNVRRRIEEIRGSVSFLKGTISSLNPDSLLERGFTITSDEKGRPITNIDQLEIGATIKTKFKSGTLISVINGKEKNYGKNE